MTSKYTPDQLKQGNATSTVLTNRSKYITVISDEPYESRKLTNAKKSGKSELGNVQHQKGSRPMHQTSLTFEKQLHSPDYESTSKEVKSYMSIIKQSASAPF